MTETTARLLLVVAVLLVASVVAYAVRRIQKPPHPTLSVQSDGDRPGVVLFTSIECAACKDTISLLRSKGIPFREIIHELEPQRFESWRALAVPLTVVLDSEGRVVAALTGAPSSRRLAGALRAADIEVFH
jgi:hypothetical protein